ncbi:MAG: helix-turn-helix domain-containing protein, partial [Raoultibacter sp.]
PYRYLTTRRIIEARSLLGAGVEPADVAASLRFSDQAHFGRVFKEITGVSPGSYRASCAQGAVE